MTKRVVILQETFPRYRVELFAEIHRRAALQDIAVQLVHGRAPGSRGERLGEGSIDSALIVRNRYLPIPGARTPAVWQPALRTCLNADLVVIEQANRLLINYVLLVATQMGGPKVAFWGHGRNFQSSPNTIAERCKSRLARMPSWWFAYTPGVAAGLRAQGMLASRITVVGNTIDAVALSEAVDRFRTQAHVTPKVMRCLYLGGFYSFKRLDFLFHAADLIAAQLPTFQLYVAGAGEQRAIVERFVESRPWAFYCGSVDGEPRAELLASAQLLLIPGLVGLVVIDSFAAGVPLVTTADALHSPEIEYLENGVNGIVMPPGAGPREYARTVIELLQDRQRWISLSMAARHSAQSHTVASAAQRFVDGISSALSDAPAGC
jgi:glycosyltransferase involved in cell wall biosynthesis